VNKPAPLKRGGRIGVLAPAGCVDAEPLAAGVEAITGKGFEVELSARIRDRKGYLAGGAEGRARDLVDFFVRSDIDAIFCARGGFGSIQLLPYLGNRKVRLQPKIFVGYSDVTILLNWLLRDHAMVTFHAPMVAMDMAHEMSARTEKYFWGTLMGQIRTWTVTLSETIRPGEAVAEMMGGCLSLLVTTLGTSCEIDTNGKLLFLEDIGEKPYRIERMLTHLKMAGKLDRLAGLILGDFTQCEGESSRDVRQIVAEMFADAPYPVVTGMASGHGQENLTLPFGVKMLLDGNAGTLSLIESPVA
jgi:muramoyltetrapeptide carboxypeptidase